MHKKKGFTLIELLVVISIIGLLSSVILASMATARNKARDASLKQNVLEFRKLMALEYSNSNSYANLRRTPWAGTGGTSVTCETLAYTGTYAANATAICNNMRRIYPTSTQVLYTTSAGGSGTFSIVTRLYNGNYFCIGSSGRNYEGPVDPDGAGSLGNWFGPGCLNNP